MWSSLQYIDVALSVCSETCCTTVQCARGGHSGNVYRAAMSGERGLSCSPVPLVPQQRGASSRPQKQPQVCQLFLQHQPWHWRPGKKSVLLFESSVLSPKTMEIINIFCYCTIQLLPIICLSLMTRKLFVKEVQEFSMTNLNKLLYELQQD